jgi:hypothetical protein
MKPGNALVSAIAILAILAAPELFAQQFAYPAKGQSAQQQEKDEAACHSWAVKQSGFDPAKPPPPSQAPQQATTATGTTPGAGVRGAARGAVVGGIAGDSGAGAAAGAAAARAQSRRQNAATTQQQQQAGTQQQQAGQAGFAKARAACLEGRGYSVK